MPAGGPPQLRRNLSVWQAVGLSVALMAPSMAANINPQGTSATVGRAVPLAFLVATVGVLLVAYVFVRLCQAYNHAGSVYGFVGATLGPRAGVVAGWALLGTYAFYGVVTSTAAGRFLSAFLDETGIWHSPPDWVAMVFGLLGLGLAFLLTVVPARRGTSVLLSVEGLTVTLILVVSAVVLVKVVSGSAPGGHDFTLSGFSVAKGTPISAVFLGVVFGFLSFAGFEASSTLGEEAANPRRDIPRAILYTAVFGGVFFVVVTAVETMGFGTDAKGVAAFTASSSLLGDLGRSYLAGWVGDLISLGAGVSAFGCALACSVGASRLLYAFARDASDRDASVRDASVRDASDRDASDRAASDRDASDRGTAGGGVLAALGRVDEERGTPRTAAMVIVPLMVVMAWVMRLAFGADSFEVFVWAGTIGTLILLVAYLAATVGAMRLLFFSGTPRRVAGWEIVLPLGALVVLGYTVYRNVSPYPTGPAAWFPVVAGLWILAGIVGVLAAPALSRRLGRRLEDDEGLQAVPTERSPVSAGR